MLNESLEKRIKYLSWAVLAIVAALCSFFIVYNAEWILGDDAIVMRRTGWGRFFPLSDTIRPYEGRFYPLSYFMYNLWGPFFGHRITATQLYLYHAIIFVLFVVMTYYLVQDILRKHKGVYRYGIAILVTFFMIGRHYPDFINCFSTGWFGAFLNIASVLFAYLFYTYKKNVLGIIAFIVLVWTTYCSEIGFVVPLAWGVFGLFLWKKSTKAERFFHVSLIVNAVVFLAIYFFFIFLKAESFYSGSHGEEVGVIENALRIIFAQKFLWVVIALLVVRFWDIARNKSEYTIYDALILTAAAHCCAGFILKLNWVLYYNRAIVISLPAVVFYLDHYLKRYMVVAIMTLFAFWYCLKIPKTIMQTNQQRKDVAQFMELVVENMSDDEIVYLYCPSGNDDSFEDSQRKWLYNSFETFLGYYIGNEGLKLERITQYSGNVGLYVTIGYNEVLSDEGNEPIIEDCVHIAHCDMRDLDVYKKIAK